MSEREITDAGVPVTVEILPLDCGAACPGGLPPTGAELPMGLVWLAAAILLVGMAFAIAAATRRGVMHATANAAPYDDVSGNHVDRARGAMGRPSRTSVESQDRSRCRDFERGDPDCRSR